VTNELQAVVCFPTSIHRAEKPDFLDAVRAVSAEHLSAQPQDLDDIFPVRMTGSLSSDLRLADFCDYVARAAWEALQWQGHDLTGAEVFFSEMWTQEHYKHSHMEQHTHGNGAQIVGFYFLDTPKGSSRPMFYDPRPGKIQINLPEADVSQVTPASNGMGFEVKPGTLLLSNAWLPHGFSRHASDEPCRFVHFNINVEYALIPVAEVI
jgi:hypothetical protein